MVMESNKTKRLLRTLTQINEKFTIEDHKWKPNQKILEKYSKNGFKISQKVASYEIKNF